MHNFSRSWPQNGSNQEVSFLFWAQKTRFLARKSVFCHRTANFINGSFLALGKMVHIQPSDQLFDFLFPSYTRFRKKKKLAKAPKSFHPPHCGWGHRLSVTALELSAVHWTTRQAPLKPPLQTSRVTSVLLRGVAAREKQLRGQEIRNM